MDHDTMIGAVQNRARLDSRGSAEKAARATLETLAERVSPGMADNVAAQLPAEIAEHLRRVAATQEEGESFDSDEFIRRVAERENAEVPEAAFHARAVLETVEEAVGGGVVRKLREQLPDDFGRLFAGAAGKMPE